MCVERQVLVRSLGVCRTPGPLGIYYPCLITTTVTKWCCTFDWVRESRYGFFARLQGCEDPNLYEWTDWAFGFGSNTFFGVTKCFDDRPQISGKCSKSQWPAAGGTE
jgi:hypothetical protein